MHGRLSIHVRGNQSREGRYGAKAALCLQAFKLMKEESGKQAQLNAQMAKLLKQKDRDCAKLREVLAGAEAKAVQLALENQKLREQVLPYVFILKTVMPSVSINERTYAA
jgi:hypothetical protein